MGSLNSLSIFITLIFCRLSHPVDSQQLKLNPYLELMRMVSQKAAVGRSRPHRLCFSAPALEKSDPQILFLSSRDRSKREAYATPLLIITLALPCSIHGLHVS
jgi:hypothetical protein